MAKTNDQSPRTWAFFLECTLKPTHSVDTPGTAALPRFLAEIDAQFLVDFIYAAASLVRRGSPRSPPPYTYAINARHPAP